MDLHREMSYPAPLDRVVDMMLDPEFQRQRCESQHALDHTIKVEPEGATSATPRVTVTTRRRLPTDQIPEFVRKFVGATIQLEEIATWLPGDAGQPHRGGPPQRRGCAGDDVRPLHVHRRRCRHPRGRRRHREGVDPVPRRQGRGGRSPVILTGLAADEKLGAAYLTGSAT